MDLHCEEFGSTMLIVGVSMLYLGGSHASYTSGARTIALQRARLEPDSQYRAYETSNHF